MNRTVESALILSAVLTGSSGSPRLDAELLLAEVLGARREQVLANPARVMNRREFSRYRELIGRRKNGEPVAYLLGRKAFWDFELAINDKVLIPRPETELLVEQALVLLGGRRNEDLTIADLGTGSGAIAIALARTSPRWRLTAVDISPDALEVAALNARQLGVTNIEFMAGDWCEPLTGRQFDLIVANPPYVASGDSHLEQESLLFEPAVALVAGENGLAQIRRIAEQSRGYLKNGARLLMEHGFDQREAVVGILQRYGFDNLACYKDLGRIDRAVLAHYSGPRKINGTLAGPGSRQISSISHTY